MKPYTRMVIFAFGLAVFFLQSPAPVRAEESLIRGCMEKKGGKFRLIGDGEPCRPHEKQLSWKKPGQKKTDACPLEEMMVWVEAATGEDSPQRGSQARPFKTITYALQDLKAKGAGHDTPSIVRVAPGTYTENPVIRLDCISLEGAGRTETIIDGKGSTQLAALSVNRARQIFVSGLTLQNGRRGLSVDGKAVIHVDEITCKRNIREGLRVVHGSALWASNLTSTDNGGDGIGIAFDGSAILTGSITSTGNRDKGLDIHLNSSVLVYGATLTTSANNRNGIQVHSTSAMVAHGSQIIAQGNTNRGIHISGSSSFNAMGSTSLIIGEGNAGGSGNRSDGIGVFGSSALAFDAGTRAVTSGNGKTGIQLGSGARAWTSAASSVLAENNRRAGMGAAGNSEIHAQGTLILNNNQAGGLDCVKSGRFRIAGEVSMTGNRNYGMGFFRTGTGDITETGWVSIANTLEGEGVLLAENSRLRVRGGLEVRASALAGVGVYRGSVLNLRGSGLDVRISGNTQCGVDAGQQSTVRMDGGSITRNGQDGVRVSQNSSFHGRGVTVSGNSGNGILLDGGSSGMIKDHCTVTGNRANDLAVYFGSRASVFDSIVTTRDIHPDASTR